LINRLGSSSVSFRVGLSVTVYIDVTAGRHFALYISCVVTTIIVFILIREGLAIVEHTYTYSTSHTHKDQGAL